MENIQSKRYAERDLADFKKVIEKKLTKAEKQLASLDAQLKENNVNKDSTSDWVDDSSNSANLQLLDTMANRIRKHIVDLKNALLRIHNKSYGICSVTGVLIDKKRLLAVPTTTKSVAAKTSKLNNRKPSKIVGNSTKKSKIPKIISRVIPKSTSSEKKNGPSKLGDELSEEWDETDQLLDSVETLDLEDEMEE